VLGAEIHEHDARGVCVNMLSRPVRVVHSRPVSWLVSRCCAATRRDRVESRQKIAVEVDPELDPRVMPPQGIEQALNRYGV